MVSHDLVAHVRRLTWLLTDGDFEALVLWCELACRSARDRGEPDGAPITAPQPTLLRDLVDATGVPRESARRKLERLAARGRVDRLGNGWVVRLASLDPPRRAMAQDAARRIHAAMGAAGAARRPK